MALSHHLDHENSPIRKFLAARFPNTDPFIREQTTRLSGSRTVRLPADQTRPAYRTLGTAIDYRIRYYYAPTPVQDLVAWTGAMALTDIPPYDIDDPLVWEDFEEAEMLVGKVYLRERQGHWQQYTGRELPSVDRLRAEACTTLPTEVILGFFRSFQDVLARYNPAGRMLDREQEEDMARHSVVLAFFEQIFRAGPGINSPLFADDASTRVSALLAKVEDAFIQDLTALSWLFFESDHHLLSDSAVLNPNFSGSHHVGGADADLIVDGCLMEIKATTQPSKEWKALLYQLLGYALLDYDDQYGIEQVGVYFARQGVTLSWRLRDLISELASRPLPPLDELRQSFREVAMQSARH